MEKQHILLLVPPGKENTIYRTIVNGKEVVKYEDKIILERRRALVGRPAGTECGNSCTCS